MVTGIQALMPVAGFGWDDVVQAAERDDDDPSDLRGYFKRVRSCNRGSELQTQFFPFLVEDEVVGYVHEGFINHLKKFQDVFTFMLDKDSCAVGAHVKLHSSLKTPLDRTNAVGDIITCLGDLIPGIRNEAYGVHMNGYVVKNGQRFLWVGKRGDFKPTYPGMLDHLVAGGLPFGITCKENLVKECEEEAGIPRVIAEKAISVGAVSYMDIEGYRFKRDVLFCYDLELPSDFVPTNEDGEVDSFKLISVVHVANIIRRTEFFKPNCSLVIMDFLFRHG